jgi:hypothetical protein
VRSEWLPVVTAADWKVGEVARTTLGQNIYSKVWSVRVRKDQQQISTPVSRCDLPSFWTSRKRSENTFEQLVYVNHEHHKVFSELLRQTYLPIATQDRACPTDTCKVTPGGCACVRPGGSPGLPTGYAVRRVIRVENSGKWGRYIAKRDAILKQRSDEEVWKFKPPVLTSGITGKHAETFGQLNDDYNEVYLWHGTPARTALSIANEDFNINLAGSTHGSMYGRGVYFAESCTKADEYSQDEPGYYEGMFALVLCRVCMENFIALLRRTTRRATELLLVHSIVLVEIDLFLSVPTGNS